MKITELQVERFGVWSDLTLPLNRGNVSVFYGPNEAGKSTLMRFIRSMLYGFRRRTSGPPGRTRPRSVATELCASRSRARKA